MKKKQQQPGLKATELWTIQTKQFRKYVAYFTAKFKESEGHGRWLKEYEDMEKAGWFTTDALIKRFKRIKAEPNCPIPYIQKEAIYYICTSAFEATTAYIKRYTYDIRIITGEIAVNFVDFEEGYEPECTNFMSFFEAVTLCNRLNAEAEEELCYVCKHSDTERMMI